MQLYVFTVLLWAWLIMAPIAWGAGDGDGDGEKHRKSSPKRRKVVVVNTLPDPSLVEPIQQTREQGNALNLEDIQEACLDVGLPPEGAMEALIGSPRVL